MELTVIGSGTIAPSSTRTAAAHWVRAGNVRVLFDCGPGTLHRVASLQLPWADVDYVAITHFHVDHWGELPALLFAMRWGTEPARSKPLTLFGPAGFRGRLTMMAGAFGDWVLDPGFPLDIVEIEPQSPLDLNGGVRLESYPTPHTEQSVAYSVWEGEARLVYTGDTGPSDELAHWAAGCDLLLTECSLPDDRPIDIHLTPSRAGELAKLAGAGKLVLTHFYPVFGDEKPDETAGRIFEGPVKAARDGDRFEI